MKFGILGAMPQEVALMARSMGVHRSVEAGMRTFFEGTWEGQEVVVVLSRVGKVSAAITTLLLLERFGVTHIVFTGLAGAIDPGLRIGDVVVADRLVQHDMDASPLPAFKRFEIPLLGKIFFETGLANEAADAAIHYTQGDFLHDVSPEKRAAFGMDRPRVFRGLVASGDQFLADPEKTADLRNALPGLLCAEMEGAAVAQVCHEMGGIPNAIIRVISDQADHSAAVDFLRFVDEVAEYLTGGIVRSLLSAWSTRVPPV
ncbi:MAG TPA: 5'-methylthioadenosine/adenosylhomocysteine nucleosidase [Terrimicrobiaceae bacterium]|nr:5'-methylthioadenosine/adenosylhomocysteine nucleosidase [Terrimicrobiaceae bacterium]